MSFSVDLAKFGQKAVNNAEKIVRKTGFDMHARIVKRTPVDTGRAKANTQISVNSLPSSSSLAKDTTKSSPIADAGQIDFGLQSKALTAVGKFNLGDTIFIYNNVEYILSLEFGSSKQAPAGMFRISFDEIVQHLGGVAA
jgi:hypothetical protein